LRSRLGKVFEASFDNLEGVLSFIESPAAASLGSEGKVTDLLVAAEEAFTNVAKHAYDGGGNVEVIVETDEGSVSLIFRDRGRAFDPLSVPPPDLDESPEGRTVGGLGIHLMRNLVDGICYRREEEMNVLILMMSTTNTDSSNGSEPAR
jgi:serine/threonine-protein kinase RsbW